MENVGSSVQEVFGGYLLQSHVPYTPVNPITKAALITEASLITCPYITPQYQTPLNIAITVKYLKHIRHACDPLLILLMSTGEKKS